MSDTFTIYCPSCQAEYELPASLREGLEGKSVSCESCAAPWVPLPASGLLSKLRQPRELPIDLTPYLNTSSDLFTTLSDPGSGASVQPSTEVAPEARPRQAVAPEARPRIQTGLGDGPAVAAGPSQAAAAPVAPAVPSLRVFAHGPDLELNAVYELGRRSYLIGKSGCHLVLPWASIPDQAIRIRSAEDGLTFEGIGGFDVPLGPVSVQAGRIQPGSAGLTLGLDPYQVVLEVSDAPGEAIVDLEGSTTGTAPLPRGDIRAQLQPPAPAAGGMPAGIEEPQVTVRDFAASTASTSSYGSGSRDVFQGFEVGLVGTEGRYKGKSFRVIKSVILIGRTTGDLVIPDQLVSGKHAQLEVLGPGQYALKDFASTNGTTVNDRPISQTSLKNGDIVGFGGVKFKFIARPKP